MSLDTTKMTVVQTMEDGYYRFIDHGRKLLTMGFMSHDALIRNAKGFSDTEMSRTVMGIRYEAHQILNDIVVPGVA